MAPKYTYGLTIKLNRDSKQQIFKEELISFLISQGVHEFVEGQISDLDIDHEYEEVDKDYYGEQGGADTPIIIYSYDRDYLTGIAAKVEQAFHSAVEQNHDRMETVTWLEGWKECFKPIVTELFYIHPPWEKPSEDAKLINVVIDPGMAFGTGQHATTQLCISAFATIQKTFDINTAAMLDVGAGSGILSIAAKKLGFKTVWACDIDPNSVIASKQNFNENKIEATMLAGSIPLQDQSAPKAFDFIVANILFVVINKIFPQLFESTTKEGYMLLSGILVEQEIELEKRILEYSLIKVQEWHQDGWYAVLLQK